MTAFHQRKSFPWFIVLALLLLNLGMLLFLWMGNGPGPRDRRAPIKVEEILGFDQSQTAQFKDIQARHFEKKDAIRKGLGMHRDSAFAQLRGGHPDTAEVSRHFRAMGEVTQAIETEIFDHFMRVRGMCKPDQLPKFDGALIEEITRPPREGHGGPGGPPPHHP